MCALPICVEGSYFAHSRDTKETVFHVPLGDIKGVLALEVLRTEFGIEPDSLDGQLLGIIERCLRFVKEIRPTDSIPRKSEARSVGKECVSTCKSRWSRYA